MHMYDVPSVYSSSCKSSDANTDTHHEAPQHLFVLSLFSLLDTSRAAQQAERSPERQEVSVRHLFDPSPTLTRTQPNSDTTECSRRWLTCQPRTRHNCHVSPQRMGAVSKCARRPHRERAASSTAPHAGNTMRVKAYGSPLAARHWQRYGDIASKRDAPTCNKRGHTGVPERATGGDLRTELAAKTQRSMPNRQQISNPLRQVTQREIGQACVSENRGWRSPRLGIAWLRKAMGGRTD